jgi:hypothetical protein
LLKVLNQDDLAARDNRREYGDAKLSVDTIRAAPIGDEQSIMIEGADKFDPAKPSRDAQRAKDRENFLQQWGEEERFLTKLIEIERNAVRSAMASTPSAGIPYEDEYVSEPGIHRPTSR